MTERIHFGPEGILCSDKDIEGMLVVPDYVKKIRPWAFSGCRKLFIQALYSEVVKQKVAFP